MDTMINQRFFLSDYRLKNGKTAHNIFVALQPWWMTQENVIQAMREMVSRYGRPVFIAEVMGVKSLGEAIKAMENPGWAAAHDCKMLPVWTDPELLKQSMEEIRRGDWT